MRGRNTENHPIGEYGEMANFQRKQHIILKLIHEEKYIVFNEIRGNRREREVRNGVKVIIVLVS